MGVHEQIGAIEDSAAGRRLWLKKHPNAGSDQRERQRRAAESEEAQAERLRELAGLPPREEQ